MTSRIEEILSAMDDACVALDREWRIVYVNAEAVRLAGESVDALIGCNHWEKWPHLVGTRLEQEYRRVAQGQATAQFEHQVVFPDGRDPLWLEIRVRPSDQGGVILFFRDIGARKHAESEAAGHLRREMLIKRIAESALRAEGARSVLETAVAGLAEELGLDRSYYVLHDPARSVGTVTCEWRRSDLPSLAGEYLLTEYAADVSSFYQIGRLQVVDDANAPDLAEKIPLSKELLDRVGLTALIRAPLSAGSAVTALVAGMTDGPRVWKPYEMALVQAVALETAEVVQALQGQEKDRRIAMVLQDALQPRAAYDVPGVRIDVYLKPALDEANVGGDFYDVFPIGRTRYAFVIGDVSGKGLEAAAQVSTVRNMLRAFLYQGASPSLAASDLNDVIAGNDLLVGFATLFVGIYDTSDHLMRYTLCGHEQPIVLTGDDVRIMETCGPPIGASQGVEYTESSITLRPGDLLALYTDGLSEAGPDWRTLLGAEGLTKILRRHASGDQIVGMAASVVADVAAFAQGRLRDDACLVVAQWMGVTVTEKKSETQSVPSETLVRPAPPKEERQERILASSPTARPWTERHLDEQFRLLVESVADYAIFLLDTHGRIKTWNKGAERIKGYTASEIVGKHFSIFYTTEDVQRGHPADELAIATAEGRYEEEGWRVRKDGTQFWANVVITALKDDTGGLYGFAKVTRDVTDRRRAEEIRFQNMRDQISRTFLRDILYSVTEGRLRFCEDETELPAQGRRRVGESEFDRFGLAKVRADVRTVAASLRITDQRLHDLVTAASEAAMNAVVHAKSARYTICEHRDAIQIWIVDHGAGIELSQLHRATLERGFTTENSLGHGFWLMLHTCDRIWLHSSSAGTTLVLEQDAIAPDPLWLGQPRDVSQFMNFSV